MKSSYTFQCIPIAAPDVHPRPHACDNTQSRDIIAHMIQKYQPIKLLLPGSFL